GRGTADEKPVADRDPGHDRETREDLTAVGERAAKTPQGAGIETGLELEDPADDRGRGSRGLADPGEDQRLGGQVEGRATQSDGPEQQPSAQPDSLGHPPFHDPGASDTVPRVRNR